MAIGPLNLDEPGEWAGLWWLPTAPDAQVPGVLRYDPEGALVLSLIGTFEDRIMSTPAPGITLVHEGRQTWDVIHGVAEKREITLLGCIPTKSAHTIGARVMSPDKQTVVATTALIGSHVGGGAEPTFSAVDVSIDDLGQWAASSALERVVNSSDGAPGWSGHISVKRVKPQVVEVDGTTFWLTHRRTLPHIDHRRGETIGRVRETAYVRIVPPMRFSLNDAVSYAGLVQDLIALATHRVAGVIWLRLDLPQPEDEPDEDQLPFRRTVNVLYSPSAVGEHGAKAVDTHGAFFTCASLPFEEVIPRWIKAHTRLQAATNMILGLRYAPARYIESNLLTAVGAAEVLHRSLDIDVPPIPKDEFRPMREAMLAQVPVAYRERLRGAFRNDPTLRDRLYALAARPDQEAMAILVPDVHQWAKRTTRARNDLAHEGTTSNHSVDELLAVVNVTTAVVILNVLHELGLPAERQREIVREHPQLRSTARAAQQWFVAPDDGS